MKVRLLLLLMCFSLHLGAQTNLSLSNQTVAKVIAGNYNPTNYTLTNPITDPHQIARLAYSSIVEDSLQSFLTRLASFENRNTGSDTLSSVKGIGAARRWAYDKFVAFGKQPSSRLLSSYFDFDRLTCGIMSHRNVVAVLPGADTTKKGIIIIEGHMDSRCENSCDTSCIAQGVEDNGSGSALVMELARTLSTLQFDRTIVFMLTTGEEQGLVGADAFADYCVQEGIPIKCVLNNDVIGGILCGQTSSSPSCPQADHVDSTQVRLFSFGGFNSPHKQLVRFIKLEYEEEIAPFAAVPMTVAIMSPEDRSGRGGDHIPFRRAGFTSIRFTAANEHGNGAPGPGYTDRQHSFRDTLGVDKNLDGIIDSFFVSFSYLKRNAGINALAAAMASEGPWPVSVTAKNLWSGRIEVSINDPNNYGHYRIGLRSVNNEFDTLISLIGSTTDTISIVNAGLQFISACSVDSLGIESFFSNEVKLIPNVGFSNKEKEQGIMLLQNRPNPFDESTIISYYLERPLTGKHIYIEISTLEGKEVARLQASETQGLNEVYYRHGHGMFGSYIYSLVVDGKKVASKKMVFTP